MEESVRPNGVDAKNFLKMATFFWKEPIFEIRMASAPSPPSWSHSGGFESHPSGHHLVHHVLQDPPRPSKGRLPCTCR